MIPGSVFGGNMNNVCIIVPCYNESATIGPLVKEIEDISNDFEIVVVNDGSEDSTSDAAKVSARTTVIDLPTNLGVGGAVQTGFKYAMKSAKDYAVKLDGDGQHDPSEITNLLQPLIDNHADIVIGSRFIVRNDGYQSSFYRRIGIKFIEIFCKLLTGLKITDPTSGFRAYNKKTVKFMADHYPSFDYPEPEELILAYRNNLRIVEVSSIMRERKAGISTISSAMSVYYMFKVTLAMLFMYIRKPFIDKDNSYV